MCDSCGCGDSNIVPVAVHERILANNERAARHNREHFRDHHVAVINLMGSPGAGKTAVLEATARALGAAKRLGVLVGDLATDNDARRVRAAGIQAEAITTGSACHLDADMVHRGLHRMAWRDLDILFIENVGNMVCPTDFRLGAEKRIVVISSTEGDDVVNKHPMMFRSSNIGVINKVDLAPFVGSNLDRMEADMRRYNPEMKIFRTNMKTGEGLEELLDAILA